MAKEKVTPEVAEEVAKEEKKVAKYYRSRISRLKVLVKDAVDSDPTTIEYVQFSPKKEKFQGDDIFVGYLKTDNKIAIKKLEGDPNVEEISKDDFAKAVK